MHTPSWSRYFLVWVALMLLAFLSFFLAGAELGKMDIALALLIAVAKTALVIELTAYPMPRNVLRLFLSRFFFKDATPHLVILVEDWLKFSSELDSMRTGTDPEPARKKPKDSILSRLPQR